MRAKTKKYDKQHLVNLGLSQNQIDKIFDESTRDISKILMFLENYDPEKPFCFDDYLIVKTKAKEEITGTQNDWLQMK